MAAVGGSVEEGRAVVEPDQTAAFAHGREHLIGQVARVRAAGAGAGMAGRERTPPGAQHIPYACVGQVGDVHDHMQAFHLLQECKARFGQTAGRVGLRRPGGGAGAQVGLGQAVLMVPGQRHHAHAKAVERAQHGGVVLADAALLGRQHRADAPAAQQRVDVGRGAHPHKVVRESGQDLLKAVGLLQRLDERIARFRKVDKAGEALQQIVAAAQAFEVDHQAVFVKARGAAVFVGFQQRIERIAVQVPDLEIFHVVLPFCTIQSRSRYSHRAWQTVPS